MSSHGETVISCLQEEITQVLRYYTALDQYEHDGATLLEGSLSFLASVKGSEKIEACFDVSISIPMDYPEELPVVSFNGDDVARKFEHINADKSFCLAVPMEQQLIFNESPCLLGFIDNLVVPFLYSYSYFMRSGALPFGERAHGNAGLLEYYKDIFSSKDIQFTILKLDQCLGTGYRPHEKCPCGSGKKSLKCHAETLKLLLSQQYKNVLKTDLNNLIRR